MKNADKEIKKSVLVIDDNKDIRLLLRDILQKTDYVVDLAEDGDTGLALFREKHPDIVVTDLSMPKVKGLDVLTEVRGVSPETPVIILSGKGTFSDVQNALKIGAYDYIVKPVTVNKLQLAVDRAWEKLTLWRENEIYKNRLEHLVHEKTRDLENTIKHLKRSQRLLGNRHDKHNKLLIRSRRNAAKYQALINKAPNGIMTIDRTYKINEVNPAFLKITGIKPSENKKPLDILAHQSFINSGISGHILECMESGEEYFYEHDFMSADGEMKFLKYSLTPIEDKGFLHEVLFIVEDITLRKKARDELEVKARYCELTGLLNQNNFMSALKEAIDQAKRHDFTVALIYLDIDDFKKINDSFGHSAGDLILKSVGRRILNSINKNKDYGIRTGGDELAVILTKYHEEKLSLIIERLTMKLSAPYAIGQEDAYKCTFSIGVAKYYGQTPEQMFKEADIAAYHAKSEGKDQCKFFRTEMTMPGKE